VHLSSVAAYGFDFPDGVDETYPVRVNGDVYTDTKVNSEAVVLAAHAAGEIEVSVIRPGDVWGPGSVWVRSPIAEMRKKTGFPLPNGGNGIFSPVYIDNFVDGMVVAVSSRDAFDRKGRENARLSTPRLDRRGHGARRRLASGRRARLGACTALILGQGHG
jgi:2-alkyl-3-oxoalkanoate reductase